MKSESLLPHPLVPILNQMNSCRHTLSNSLKSILTTPSYLHLELTFFRCKGKGVPVI